MHLKLAILRHLPVLGTEAVCMLIEVSSDSSTPVFNPNKEFEVKDAGESCLHAEILFSRSSERSIYFY